MLAASSEGERTLKLPTTTAPSTVGSRPWDRTDMPNCRGMKAFIIPGGAGYVETIGLMAEAGFQRALTVETADVVVFLGGADVNPQLYDQKCLSKTRFDTSRDTLDEFYFHKCVKQKVPMFGICRGAQFLHVMNGGILWQDVNNHAGPSHNVVDVEEDVTFESTSLHHQMIQWQKEMTLIAVTERQVATHFEDEHNVIDLAGKGAQGFEGEIEVEAGAYLDTLCFFTQGHPEIGNPEYRSWTMFKLHDFLMDWLPFVNDPDWHIVQKEASRKAEIDDRDNEESKIAEEVVKQIG